MVSDRQRILELALESLINKKKELDAEIEEISRELRGSSTKAARVSTRKAKIAPAKKRPRFSKDERLRRSQRMKAYWENWRKKKGRKK
jgi:hypothetical protein